MASPRAKLFTLGLAGYFVVQVVGEDVLAFLALVGGEVLPAWFTLGVAPGTLEQIGTIFGMIGAGLVVASVLSARRSI